MSDQTTPGEDRAEQLRSLPLGQLIAERPGLASAVIPEDPRRDPQVVERYARSYLIMRIFVGAIGIAVPLVLVLGDWWLGGDPVPQDSLSAYYYAGVRELFVGLLTAIAVFLFTYRVAERSWDNNLTLLAGLAVLGVVIFPTGRPDHVEKAGTGLTALQAELGERLVEKIHFGSAAFFIGSLAVISVLFGVDEWIRGHRRWPWVHWGSAIAIGLAVGYIVLCKWTDLLGPLEPRWWLLLGEWWAVWAFAFSWLTKGLEVETLQRTGPMGRVLHVVLFVVTFGLWLIVWRVVRRRIVRASV